MTTYTTYDQVGKKEDVSDIISDITPTDTPFFTMVRSEKVSARTFNWLEDSLNLLGRLVVILSCNWVNCWKAKV